MTTLNPAAVVRDYLIELKAGIESFPTTAVENVANVLRNLPPSNTLYVIGNGGSATTASHMVTDLGIGSLRRRNPV